MGETPELARLWVVACVSTRSLVTVSDWDTSWVPPFIPKWELEWQPHTGKGRRASLGGASSGLGLLRGREGETGWLHLFLPGGTFSSLFPQILEGCFCRGLWWPHPRIVRREHICGPGDVKYVQDRARG